MYGPALDMSRSLYFSSLCLESIELVEEFSKFIVTSKKGEGCKTYYFGQALPKFHEK